MRQVMQDPEEDRSANAPWICPQEAERFVLDLYFEFLKEGQVELHKLYTLPLDALVELLGRLQQECKRTAQQRDDLLEWQQERYIVDPPIAQKLVGKDVWDHKRDVLAKWSPSAEEQKPLPWEANCCDPNAPRLLWEKSSSNFVLKVLDHCDPEGRPNYSEPYEVMSSALLLYRLMCLFPGKLDTNFHADQYKAVWGVELTHKKTHWPLWFGEHKASTRAWPSHYPQQYDQPDHAQFKSDVLELMNLLFSPTCPHTYGVVAGSIA